MKLCHFSMVSRPILDHLISVFKAGKRRELSGPRQDQLQEMFFPCSKGNCYWMLEMLQVYYSLILPSLILEQIWLAFILEKKNGRSGMADWEK